VRGPREQNPRKWVSHHHSMWRTAAKTRSAFKGRRSLQRHERIRVKAGEPESQNIRFQGSTFVRTLDVGRCHSRGEGQNATARSSTQTQVDTGRKMAGQERQGRGRQVRTRMSGRYSSVSSIAKVAGRKKTAEQRGRSSNGLIQRPLCKEPVAAEMRSRYP
jgi:phage anti-repressor protein